MSSESALSLSFGTIDSDESLTADDDVGDLQLSICRESDADESMSVDSFISDSDVASSCDGSGMFELRQSFLESEHECDVSVCGPIDENNQALYEGSDITLVESNLALFQFAVRHGLSGKAFNELLLLFAAHLPQSSKCSMSVYRLKKFFVENFSNVKARVKHYCSVCHDMLDSEEPCSRE